MTFYSNSSFSGSEVAKVEDLPMASIDRNAPCFAKITPTVACLDHESTDSGTASRSSTPAASKHARAFVSAFVAPKFTVKNTFVDVSDDVDRDDRRRVITAPAGYLDYGSDSDEEDEQELGMPDNSSSQGSVHVLSPMHPASEDPGHIKGPRWSPNDHTSLDQAPSSLSCSSLEDPTVQRSAQRVVVKNTFIDVQDDYPERDDRPRNKSAPANIIDYSDSDSEDEEIVVSGFVPKLTPVIEIDAVQTKFKDSGMCSTLDGAASKNVKGCVWELSQARDGSRRVQEALEEASSAEERHNMALELKGRVWEAAHDLQANFVLQKVITLMRSSSLQFIIDELTHSKGAARAASRNKYACRVIQRLFEFCSPAQVADIADDLLSDIVTSCCDKYGKYVMQVFLDHATAPQVLQLMNFLAKNAQQVAVDSHGFSIICKALSVGRREDQARIGEAISAVPGLLEHISATQGQFLAKTLQTFQGQHAGACVEPRAPLSEDPVAMVVADRSMDTSAGGAGSRRTAAKNFRRGNGGGAAAQREAEARDLLESLRAACARRSIVRIKKALARAQNAFSSQLASPLLQMEALQTCEQAHQLLWTLSLESGKYPYRV